MVNYLLTCAYIGFLALPAVFGDHAGGFPRRILALRALSWVGLVSYGVFLWHFHVLDWLNRARVGGWLPGVDTVWLLLAGLAVVLPIAALSYYLLELPFLRLKRRWGHGAAMAGSRKPEEVPGHGAAAEQCAASTAPARR